MLVQFQNNRLCRVLGPDLGTILLKCRIFLALCIGLKLGMLDGLSEVKAFDNDGQLWIEGAVLGTRAWFSNHCFDDV